MGMEREIQQRALKVVTGVLGGHSAGNGFWDDQGEAIDVYFEETREAKRKEIRERMVDEIETRLIAEGMPEEEAHERAGEELDEAEVQAELGRETEQWESGCYWLVGSWKKVDVNQENIHGYAPDKDKGDYAAIYDSNDNYIQVVWSKTVAYCNLCSPCFPNQGDLDSHGHDVVAYALPEDCVGDEWFVENDTRPMNLPVWESMQFWLNHYEQMNGSFRTALWDAIFKADLSNLRALAKGFPMEVRCRCNYAGIKL